MRIALLLLLIAVPIHGQSNGCAALDFDLPANFASGLDAHSFTIADLNGDLAPDIVTPNNTNYDRGGVSVAFGDGVGGFAPPQFLNANARMSRVAIGDINRDGKPDIVGGYWSNSATIWLNDGLGGFGIPATVSLQVVYSEGLYELKILDFNGDGSADIVWQTDTRLYLFTGNGTGGFTASTPSPMLWPGYNSHIAVGNFNADNFADLAITRLGSFPWQLGVILGNATGTLTATSYNLSGGASGIALGDVNGDGLTDIVMAAADGYQPPLVSDPYFVQPWFGRGDGTFTAGARYALPKPPQGVALGDFNGDGKLDAAANLGYTVAVRNGVGDGTFQTAAFWQTPDTNAIMPADANLDGKTDLIAFRGGALSSVTPLIADADGFTSPRSNLGGGSIIVSGDLNNDGRSDLVSTYKGSYWTSEITTAIATADGNLSEDRVVETVIGLEAIDIGDFNGDGNQDILTAHANNSPNKLAIHYGDGTGALGPPTAIAWTTPVKNILAGDFNGDTRVDIFVADDTPRGVVLLNQGNAVFTPVNGFAITNFNYWLRPEKGDFNRDGKIDLLLTNGGSPAIWLGTGDGRFTVSTQEIPANYHDNFAVGDFNGDGNLDFAGSGTQAVSKIVRYFGDGQGGVGEIATQELPFGRINSFIAADFNADLLTDLALGIAENAGNLTVIPSTSQAPYFGERIHLSIGGFSGTYDGWYEMLAPGDANGDGKPDIAYATGVNRGFVVNSTGEKPCISVGDVTINEPDSGSSNAVFTVQLSAPAPAAVRFNYIVGAGRASLGSDIQALSGRVEIPAGATTASISVPILGDVLDEFDEDFVVTLSAADNAAIMRTVAKGTIVDNDAEPTITVSDRSITESVVYTQLLFDVALSAPSGKPVSFRYVTTDGTAIVAEDYPFADAVVTIQPGTTTASISTYAIGDSMFETDEYFYVNISEPVNATVVTPQAKGTIVNEDPIPTVSISTGFGTEPDTGILSRNVTVQLTNPSYLPITANIITSDGTAIGGLDYVAFDKQVTIPATQLSATTTVDIIGDLLDETNEFFFVNVYNPVNAVVLTTQAPSTIVDNDPIPGMRLDNISVPEGNVGIRTLLVPVRLLVPSGREVRVNYTTADGTATAPGDYVAANGTLIFASGETVANIPLTINGDATAEADETFEIVLNAPTNATIVQGRATVTIQTDAFPIVTIGGKVLSPLGLGLRNAVVTLTDTLGFRRNATTSSFGIYSFDNVPAGQSYVLSVSSKRYRFAARSLLVNGNIADVDFVGLE